MFAWLSDFLFRVAVAFGLFAAGSDHEKRKQAEKKASDAKDEAEKWANRPADRNDTVVRLRKLAKKRPD